MIKAVIFDLDDTLIAEREWMHSGYAAVAAYVISCGISDRAPSELVAMMHECYERDSRHVFDGLAGQLGVDDPQRASFPKSCADVYRHHTPELPTAEAGRAAIASCRPFYRLVIATGGYAVAQRAKVLAGGFAPLVDAVQYSDDLPAECEKPHVRWFERAAELAGVHTQECVHVADNPLKDFEPARSLGMRTIRVRRPDGIQRDLESAAVDVEVVDIGEVAGVLAKWR